MKICIFGAGAVGGYFGGRLAQAGHDVTFIARGDHLAAILAGGLKVSSIAGDFSIAPAKATDRPDTLAPMDVILCCVKSWQVTAAAEQMRPMLGPQTVVISLQNGVDAPAELADALSPAHVLPGLCKLITMVEKPGHIRHAGADPYLAFGEADGTRSDRAAEILQALSKAHGMTVHLSENIDIQLWRKFMLIAPLSGIGALTRAPIGVIRSVPETRHMLMETIREIYDVARGHAIMIEPAAIDDTMAFIDQLPDGATASMQRDMMAGRKSELHEQNGAVVRYGKEAGVPTPINRFIYHSLLPQEQMAREVRSESE